MTRLNKLLNLPLHLFILVIYFIMFGYVQNLELFTLNQVLPILAYFLVGTAVIYLVLRIVIGAARADAITLVVILSFFLFGHLYEILSTLYLAIIPLLPTIYMSLSVFIIFALLFIKPKFLNINKNLNLVLIILAIVNIVQFTQQDNSGNRSSSDEDNLYNPSSNPTPNRSKV